MHLMNNIAAALGTTIRVALSAFWLFIIYLLIFKVAFIQTRGPSMYPTMWTGDLCITYKTQDVQRGDIIIIDMPDGTRLVKRVIGLPGERLFFNAHTITLLDQKNNSRHMLLEEYIKQYELVEPKIVQLRQDEVWIMGDNRQSSMDSRDFGPVKINQIYGKVVFILGRMPNVQGCIREID